MKIKVSPSSSDIAHICHVAVSIVLQTNLAVTGWPESEMWTCGISTLLNLLLLRRRVMGWQIAPCTSVGFRKVLKPLWVKSSSSMNQSPSGKEIIDTRDYADLRNTLGTRKFSECKLRQPWKQEALHHDGRRDKARGAQQTKKDCFNRREASVIESYFIQTFYPTHPSSVPRDDRTTSLFPPGPGYQ